MSTKLPLKTWQPVLGKGPSLGGGSVYLLLFWGSDTPPDPALSGVAWRSPPSVSVASNSNKCHTALATHFQ